MYYIAVEYVISELWYGDKDSLQNGALKKSLYYFFSLVSSLDSLYQGVHTHSWLKYLTNYCFAVYLLVKITYYISVECFHPV